MKKYQRASKDENGSNIIIDVGLSWVLADCVASLLEAGLDEDAHHWDSWWQELDDDDLEFALSSSGTETIATMIEVLRPILKDTLKRALDERKEERKREHNA